jgi:hypothetical protein
VRLDGLPGHEQPLGDIRVAEAGRRQLGDLTLARGQRLGAGRPLAARPRARGLQLRPCLLGERRRAGEEGDVEGVAKRLAGLS